MIEYALGRIAGLITFYGLMFLLIRGIVRKIKKNKEVKQNGKRYQD